ncbi:MAG: deoxyribodipyrimidine photolyase [Sphingobacteriia bacterium]|nr:MAG: deoxyribodipyrimidine photolyase [Sphingobacteriia bacterium]
MLFTTDHVTVLKMFDAINPRAYAQTRNFGDGAVTQLSPYFSRGLISGRQVVDVLLKQHGFKTAEKLIQELAWREYYQRVWQAKGNAIFQDLKQAQQPVLHHAIPKALLKGETGISALDRGIADLATSGYVHNHIRMYLAMLATNVGQAHWRKPADWMYYHLLDGDLASNALSWQWVAGSFSAKKYWANQDNINHYFGTKDKGSFLDRPYEGFPLNDVPSILLDTENPLLTTTLPPQSLPHIDKDLPTLVYSHYTLDPLWHAGEKANRILLLSPDHFQAHPISEKVLGFVLDLAQNNLPGIQVFTGNFADLQKHCAGTKIFFKEHPIHQGFQGQEEPRDWIFPHVKGYYPSFFAFWKKASAKWSSGN